MFDKVGQITFTGTVADGKPKPCLMLRWKLGQIM